MPYKYYPPVYVTINGKEVEMKNSYGWYSAEYIQAMNIPRCNIDIVRKPNWYSATQCKKIKMPVTEGEKPVAASSAMHGYYLVFERDHNVSFRDL